MLRKFRKLVFNHFIHFVNLRSSQWCRFAKWILESLNIQYVDAVVIQI